MGANKLFAFQQLHSDGHAFSCLHLLHKVTRFLLGWDSLHP